MARADKSPRLDVRYFDDSLVLSGGHAWTYMQVPLVPYEFLSRESREDLCSRVTLALSQLVTNSQDPVDVHLKVVHRPFDARRWESGLRKKTSQWQPAPVWDDYVTRMRGRVEQIGFTEKHVFLGVRLGPRTGAGSPRESSGSGLLGDVLRPVTRLVKGAEKAAGLEDPLIPDWELQHWWKEAENVRRILGQSSLRAVGVEAEKIAELIMRPLWPGLEPPPASATPARRWGPGQIHRLFEGVLTNNYKYVEVQQPTSDGGIARGYAATLAVSRFPDVLHFPDQEPWMHFAESLLIPVDFSTRMSVVPAQRVQKDVGKKLADAKDQAQHIAESGTAVPLKVREQLDVATVLEYQIDKERMPWAYARHHLTVTGSDPEQITSQAKTLVEKYRELGMDLAWPSGEQLDLLLESVPGDKVRSQAYQQRQELAVVAGGMPIASSDCGDNAAGDSGQSGWVGPYLGATNSRVLQPVFFSPHVAMTRNYPPGVAITGAPGGGKALDVDTPLPTPAGWTRMGDVQVGDRVLSEAGVPCTVTHATDVMVNHRCYRVVFDDGAEIVADAEHRWFTHVAPVKSDRPGVMRVSDQEAEAVMLLRELDPQTPLLVGASVSPLSHQEGGVALRAREVAAQMWSHASGLPAVDAPAVRTTEEMVAAWRVMWERGLAYWVDVADSLDLPEVETPVSPYWVGSELAAGCEDATLEWAVILLRGSRRQREAMWQGFLDSSVNALSAEAYRIVCKSQRDQRVVEELAHSLGLRRVSDIAGEVRFGRAAVAGLCRRRIVAIEDVESRPVRCITVDSPSHLYLAGREMIPTHNTFLAFNLAYQMAASGVWTVYIDPKADAKPMGELPGLGNPRVFDLRDGNDGMLDPFSLGSNKSESSLLALETLRLLLGGSVSEEREEALLNAIEVVVQTPRPSLGAVVDVLSANQASSSARNLGAVLRTIRELPFARLCFSPIGSTQLRPEDGLTVVTLLGLDLPNASTQPEDYSYENRLAVSVMYLLTRYARQLMLNMNKNYPKAICIDEAWAITSTPQGAKLIPEIARMGRSHNTALVLVSQNAGDLMAESVTNSLSTKFAFRSTIPAEVDSVLELMGLSHDEGFQSYIRNLSTGQCLMQDVDGRVAPIQIDNWDKELMRAFDTNPETRGKKG